MKIFTQGEIALLWPIFDIFPIRNVIVLNVLYSQQIRYSVLYGAHKIIALECELFSSYKEIEEERKKRELSNLYF